MQHFALNFSIIILQLKFSYNYYIAFKIFIAFYCILLHPSVQGFSNWVLWKNLKSLKYIQDKNKIKLNELINNLNKINNA